MYLYNIAINLLATEAVRRNWCGPEQYDAKVVRLAICECLKHAVQRQSRRQARTNSQTPNEFVDEIDDNSEAE